jgi:formylglycine-generating enzyme
MIRQAITVFAVLMALAVCGAGAAAGTINISLVTVADPGNLPDPLTGYGAVPYVYQMGEFDVTMSQYAAFLNSVAKTGDPYGVYNSSMFGGLPTIGIKQTSNSGTYSYSVVGNGNVPVDYVSWADSVRFVNWLENGQPVAPEGPGTTETGSYALNGGTSDAALMAVSRSPTASWVLPNVSEWYKSAYYSGGTNSGYWTYATQSNTTPSNVLSATGTNNANFLLAGVGPPTFGYTDPLNYVTAVGAFTDSPSHYGTYDQSGEVDEWNETATSGVLRGLRGGAYDGTYLSMMSQIDDNSTPSSYGRDAGFRVAQVPEPNGLTLILAAVGGLFSYRSYVPLLRFWKKGLSHAFEFIRVYQNRISTCPQGEVMGTPSQAKPQRPRSPAVPRLSLRARRGNHRQPNGASERRVPCRDSYFSFRFNALSLSLRNVLISSPKARSRSHCST